MKTTFLVLLCLGFVAMATADVKFVTKKRTVTTGQPAKASSSTTFIKGTKRRYETIGSNTYQIHEMDSGRITTVSPEKKLAVIVKTTSALLKQNAGAILEKYGGSLNEAKPAWNGQALRPPTTGTSVKL